LLIAAGGAEQATVGIGTSDVSILSLAYSPDGRQLAAACSDGKVSIHDPTTGAPLREWPLPGPVHQVAYAPDGRHLLTGNGNGPVYVLRLAALD
jgi:WD40 repeat protein